MDYRLASDGKKVSLLGYGAMRLPDEQDVLNRQVRFMLEHGVNYFDTSPAYCRGTSEGRLGQALAVSGYGREDYLIATKLSNFSPTQYSLSACKDLFAKSLRELRTDYIDNYLLHSIGNGGFATFSKRYLDNGALDWCCELRAQKRIRNLGFSFHGDPKTFTWCLEHHDKYQWDFCQIQLNYVDWKHAKATNERNLDAEYLYRELTAKQIPVIVMEPLLGGRLARYNWAIANELKPLDPDATLAKWALRFCGSFDNVMTILSGMTFSSHIEENIATYSPLRKCSADELAALERAAVAMLNLATIPCNCCNYCMPCPYGLDIPALLTFRNRIAAAQKKPAPSEILRLYEQAVPEPLRRAEHCTGCGRCLSHCPQQIDIAAEIGRIDAWVEDLKTEVVK